MGKPIVYMWPKTSPHNKYSELLTNSIEQNGLQVEHYDQKAMFKPRRGDIVHLHWPSNSYTASAFPLTVVKSVFFALLLLAYNTWRAVVGRFITSGRIPASRAGTS